MRRRWLAALIALLVVAGSTAAGWFGWTLFDAPGPLAESRVVVVPHGGAGPVSAALHDAGVIGPVWPFRIAALLTRHVGSLHAAELSFPEQASLHEVLTVLRTARPVQHFLTIPEGLTALQIVSLVTRAEALTGDTPTPNEGAVLPETYAYERGMTRAALVSRATRAMDGVLARAWAARAPGLPLANPRQALVLASIVEHETGRSDERPHVAAVFLNRLRLGMKLQSDPTVIYGLTGGAGGLDHRLTRFDLEGDTPYNTYRIPGLPPSPIDNPGSAAIQAATQPAASGDLYFVADGTGGHVFSETLAEHRTNVMRYRSLMKPGETDPRSTP